MRSQMKMKLLYSVTLIIMVLLLLSLSGILSFNFVGHTSVKEKLFASGRVKHSDTVPVKPFDTYRIVIDPGHGGKDPGAIGVSGKYERDYTLSLAQKVYDLLKQDSKFEPFLTRQDDSFIELEDRPKIANDLHADAFISIHGNTYEDDPEVSGTETYYLNEGDGSSELAQDIQGHLVGALGFKDRGVRVESWKVLVNSQVPAVLTEIGYLTNGEEESVMRSDEGESKAAQAIVEALKQYFS